MLQQHARLLQLQDGRSRTIRVVGRPPSEAHPETLLTPDMCGRVPLCVWWVPFFSIQWAEGKAERLMELWASCMRGAGAGTLPAVANLR